MIYLVANKNNEFRLFLDKPIRGLDFWYYIYDIAEKGVIIPKALVHDRFRGITWDSEPIEFRT